VVFFGASFSSAFGNENFGSSSFWSAGGKNDGFCSCFGGGGGSTVAVSLGGGAGFFFSSESKPISSNFFEGMLTTSSTASTTSSTASSMASSTVSATLPGTALISSTVSSTLRLVASAILPGVALISSTVSSTFFAAASAIFPGVALISSTVSSTFFTAASLIMPGVALMSSTVSSTLLTAESFAPSIGAPNTNRVAFPAKFSWLAPAKPAAPNRAARTAGGTAAGRSVSDRKSVATSTYRPTADPKRVAPTDVAICSSSALRGGGGGLEGTTGFLSPPPAPKGSDSLGSLGSSGRSMIAWETSSERSFALGGGGGREVVALALGLAGSAFLATGLGAANFGLGFSGSEGEANLSLNPGMKSPVVDDSVSNSLSPSSSPPFFAPSPSSAA